MSQTTIYTIGHSTREFDELLACLRHNSVQTLVDVRSFPSSRKYPQWNQDAIVAALPADLQYRWIRDLGGRRHTPAGVASPNRGWRVKAFSDYADYMQTPAFAVGLAELTAIAQQRTPAIMCSEALPWRCHRRLITDALLVRGYQVQHIMSVRSTKPASLTPFAAVDGTELTYPSDGDHD